MKIAIYIIDFKTSKQISYEYIIQTCAYMWLINNGFFPEISHIDGVGIIRVDKEDTSNSLIKVIISNNNTSFI